MNLSLARNLLIQRISALFYFIAFKFFGRFCHEVPVLTTKIHLWSTHFSVTIFLQFQLLESYRSLTLEYMAEAFGVTEDYMDGELSR